MQMVLFGNAPHIISLPKTWGPNNIWLNNKMQSQKSRLYHMLETMNKSLTNRENFGDIIYYLDTMPVYINTSGSFRLTKGVMYPFPFEEQ